MYYFGIEFGSNLVYVISIQHKFLISTRLVSSHLLAAIELLLKKSLLHM